MVCNEPGAISDGYVTASKSRYGIHDAVGYICHQGYSLVGSPLITCNGSHWTAKPTCSLNIMDNGKFICKMGRLPLVEHTLLILSEPKRVHPRF